MNILAIGSTYTLRQTPVPIKSNVSLLDYDALVIDVEHWFSELFSDVRTEHGKPVVSPQPYNEFKRQLDRWNLNVDTFLREGRTVFVFPYRPPDFHVTSSSNQLEIAPEHIALGVSRSFFPAVGMKVKRLPGLKEKLWATLEKSAFYRAILAADHGKPCMTIDGTDKAIARIVEWGPGNVVFIPCFDARKIASDPEIAESRRAEFGMKQFFAELDEFAASMSPAKGKQSFEIPAWANALVTEDEIRAEGELTSLRAQICTLELTEGELVTRKKAITDLKALYCGQGTPLVEATKQALTQLGFCVENGPEGRDDLIIKDGDAVAVIEIKGRQTGSAAEKDAAQLEKWVSRYHEETSIEPKGVLIINAFADTPLAERSIDVFPNQMLKYVMRKEMCLLSGIQLFCLAKTAMDDVRRAEIRQAILTTNGVFPESYGGSWSTLMSAVATKK